MGFPVLVVVAALAAQSAAAAPSPTSAVDAIGQGYYLFVQGRLLDEQGDLAGAIANYRDALKLLPNSPEIHAELAAVFARQGQTADAETEAKAAVAIDPDNAPANQILGWIDSMRIDRANGAPPDALMNEAIAHLEKAIAGPGDADPSAELTLGQLYLRAKQPAKAVETLRRFVDEHPDYPEGVTALADALEASGKSDEADQLRAAILKAEPAGIAARVRAIENLEAHDQWSEAAAGWASIIQSSPAGAIYRERYAAAKANSGDLKGAADFLHALTDQSPGDISAWYLLAEVDDRAGDGAGAEAAAQKIAEIAPADPRGPLALAQSHAVRKDYKGVIAALEARVLSPTDTDVTSGAFSEMATAMATAQTRMGDHKGAIDTLEHASKRAPKDEDLQFTLGAAYDEDHRYDQAEHTFRSLIGANPKNAEALNYLGYMMADHGRNLDEAVDLVTRALAIDVGNPSYLDSLGWAYFKKADLEKARDPLEKAAAAEPKVSVIQVHLGDLYFEMKRYADAAAAFDRALAGDRGDIDPAEITKMRDRARSLATKS